MRKSLAIAAFILLLLFCVVPVAVVFVDSFVGAGGLTFAHYRQAFSRPDTWTVLGDSALIAGASTLFALLIGVPYAFFVTRVRIPLRSVFGGLYVLPLVLPPLLSVMGWSQFLMSLADDPGAAGPIRLISGIRGVATLFAFAYFPFVVLFAKKAFLEIGAGMEEAARMSHGPLRAFFRITLRLSVPTILAGALFVFLFSISDFSVVDYVSTVLPVDQTVTAYPFRAFAAWNQNFKDSIGQREAAALGLPLAVIGVGLLVGIHWLVRRGRSVTIVSGHVRPGFVEDQSRPATRWLLRIGGLLFVTVVIALSVGVPVGRIVHEAMGRDGRLLTHLKEALFEPGNARIDLGHSLIWSALSAIGMALLATVLAHHMVRRGPRREALVMTLSFLPLAFGPIMFGSGLIRTWNHSFLEIGRFNLIYDTPVVVFFMMIGKYLPFALAAVASTMRRVDPGYEEAAAVSGVPYLRRMVEIVGPLAARGILVGVVLGFVFSLRELDTAVIIASANRSVMMKIYTWVHIARDTNVASLSLILILLIAIPFLLWSVLSTRRMEVL